MTGYNVPESINDKEMQMNLVTVTVSGVYLLTYLLTYVTVADTTFYSCCIGTICYRSEMEVVLPAF